jgi:hypothetical protein
MVRERDIELIHVTEVRTTIVVSAILLVVLAVARVRCYTSLQGRAFGV